MFNFNFILINISTIILIIFLIFLIRLPNKRQIHYSFIGLTSVLLLWSFSALIDAAMYYFGYWSRLWLTTVTFFAISFTPVFVFLTGYIYYNNSLRFVKKYCLLFIVPVISTIMVFTNDFHHLFFIHLSRLRDGNTYYGPYYYVHTGYSYILILTGLYYLIYSSIKNSGLFAKQSLLIVVGALVPFVINIIDQFDPNIGFCFWEPIFFAFTVICWAIAILKYDLLNVMPVAQEKIISHMSDSFVVVDERLNIIDYNRTFYDNFKDIIDIKKTRNLLGELRKKEGLNISENQLLQIIEQSKESKKTVSLEKEVISNGLDKVFDIDITPIFNHGNHVGTIILFKDITELRKAHKQLLEQERFYSLGQLIGGIAHDINTPLSTEQAILFSIEKKAKEILENKTLAKDEYEEIAKEIIAAVNNGKSSNDRISKTIESVRNHTRNLSIGDVEIFSLKHIVELLQLMLKYKLKECKSTISYKQDVNDEILIKGDSGKLQQVLMNLVNNAIESYDERGGPVEVYSEDEGREVIVSVKDYGQGIPENIKEHVFKEILTTKGVKGTGMGLYFSKSIIEGNFRGKIWLQSQEGVGTTVYIAIPKE